MIAPGSSIGLIRQIETPPPQTSGFFSRVCESLLRILRLIAPLSWKGEVVLDDGRVFAMKISTGLF